ncbi:MAG: hypothetical protein DRN71_04390, partial [Candidatus Nanohalarchaeota archaeon]
QNSTTLQNTNNSIITNNTYTYELTISTSPIQLITCTNTNITENIIQYTFPAFPTDISILLRHSAQSSVTGNTIDNANTAIELQNTNSTHIINNTITDATTSITLTCYDCTLDENTIEKNTITNSNKAISTQNTHNTKITQNKITSIKGAQSITLTNTTQDNITENTFNTGTTAITLKNANNTLIQFNNFSSYAQTSIEFDTQSYNTANTIKDNTITGGKFPLKILNNYKSRIINNIITDATNTAIYINNTNTTNITQNTIEYSPAGIQIEISKNNQIDNNTIKHITETGFYSSDTTPYSNADNTISNNYIQNTSYGINLQNIARPKIIGNTIILCNNKAIQLYGIYNATIRNNTISNSGTGLYIQNSEFNNITENIFKNNADKGIELNSLNNSLWLNNFSDTNNVFKENNNDYCIIGIDNNYHESINDSYPLSCNRIFTNSFNDTAIYINETIKFKTNTFGGESNYTSLNITINNTNYTMTLTEGDNIIGNWTYVFKDTLTPGRYDATHLYYHEADDDENSEILGLFFEVTQLNLTTDIEQTPKSINETILIEATVQNNATSIEYVKSEIYWNNTLKETLQLRYQYGYIENSTINYVYKNSTNQTQRSGPYNVSTTVYADQTQTVNDTFFIRYGTSDIRINTTPNIIAYNTTAAQNYTITAIEGDLNNITITFNSTNTSIINITTPTQHIPYLNASDTLELYINITANNTGEAQINVTAAPTNGTLDTQTKNITVKKINMITYTTPPTANVTQTINITAEVWDNTTQIKNITAKIYRNNTQLIDTLLLTYQKTETSQNTMYLYKKTTYPMQRSGNYTVNITAYATNNARHNTYYYINYGTANITINHTPQLVAYNTTTTQNYTITAIGGDLNNITIIFNSTNTSIINTTTPSLNIPYMNSSDIYESYINVTALNTGTAQVTINTTIANGTADVETKNITVKKINLTAYTPIYPKNISENLTITAIVQNNVSEITNVTAEIQWNGSSIATVVLAPNESITGYGEDKYTYRTTIKYTQRSGNYTVIVTAYATNHAIDTVHYYVNYGYTNITIYIAPSQMNTNTIKTQSVNITAVGGDLENITAAITIDNPSKLNLALGENATQNQSSLYINNTCTIYWQLNATDTPNATINISVNAYNTTDTSKQKTIHIRELILETSLNATTINITQTIQLYANITGNITNIEYITANITWNQTSKQNITLNYYHYYPAEEKHAYICTITNTERSGNYEAFIEAKADITINTIETFFVNYGQPEITFGPDPQKLNVSENRTQEITIKPKDGDLANITVKLTSDNETILNLSDTQDPIQTIDHIFYSTYNEGETIQYNITGKDQGTTNITINVTSENNSPETGKKEIEVTGTDTIENNAPNVTAIWTNSSIDTYNLLDTITIYANISDDSGLETKIAEITKPDGHKENKTMTWSGTANTYKTQNPFTNTTNTSNYTIKIHAIDYYGNANNTETKNITLTNIYPTTTIDTYQLYNRGENATITIYVYDVNNNLVYNFNTSLNITYESNTTTLLENNQTDTYIYYINTSILGIHNLSANITKNGNTASNTSAFNVTNILDVSISTYTVFMKQYSIRPLYLYSYHERGDPYTNNLNVTLSCYNDTDETDGTIALKKISSNKYTYEKDFGIPECYSAKYDCRSFNVVGNITDPYNNSGTKLLSLSTSGCTTPQDPSDGGGGSSSSGGIAGLIQNATERVKEYIYGNQTNTTTIISDFKFTISKKETRINQGEDTTIIATLDNIGDIHQKITATITKQCCNITLKDKTYSIRPKNKQDIPIRIHASLTTNPGEYLTTITMASENITKAETFTITIQENSLITDLKNVENRITEHEKEIESYTESGLNTAHLKKALNELKSHIENAKQYIKKDDLKNLKTSISEANKKSNYITLELLRLKTQKWLYENKEIIAVTIIAIIILSYLAIYFIIPYYYLQKELKDLKSKELKFKDEERTVQKQYFMRQLDEATFNKLMQEKHSALLDVRSQIKQIEEKTTLLTRGKLNLKKEEHSKYFILNKITKNKQASTEKKFDIKEKVKLLKEQEYNLIQSTKEAEKNYYSRIITQDELEQITNNNRAKTKTIKTQLHILEKQQSASTGKDLKPKASIITKIKQKYTQYKISKEKSRIENKIQALEKKDTEMKDKEKQAEKEIELLKKQDNTLIKKEKEQSDSQ